MRQRFDIYADKFGSCARVPGVGFAACCSHVSFDGKLFVADEDTTISISRPDDLNRNGR